MTPSGTTPKLALALFFTACTGTVPTPEPVDASVEVDSTFGTLVHVEWTSDEPVATRVSWSAADGLVGKTPLDAVGTSHTHTFIAGYAGAKVELGFLTVGEDGAETEVGSATVLLGDAPSDLPEVIVEAVADGPPTPFVHIATQDLSSGTTSLQVVDWSGRPVWWSPDEYPPEFVEATQDGRGLVYAARVPGEEAALAWMTWAGEVETAPAPGAHHAVHARADGAVGVCRSEVEGDIAADVLSVVTPDGRSRDLWSGFTLDLTRPSICDGLVVENGAKDGTHCNGISYDEQSAVWYVSLYCQGSVLAIDDATGDVLWGLGGDENTLDVAPEADFPLQHSPRAIDGGLLLFDNGSSSTRSRVIDIGLAGNSAGLRREWAAPDAEYTPIVGEVTPYGDGVLVGFGAMRTIYWLGAEEEVKGKLRVEGTEVVTSVAPVTSFEM